MPHSDNGKGIVIIGDGGHSRAVQDIIRAMNGYSVSFCGQVQVSRVIGDSRVLTEQEWDDLRDGDESVVVAIGQIKSSALRRGVVEKLSYGCAVYFPTLISPTAYVSPLAYIGVGTVVMHDAVVNAGAVVGRFGIINTSAVVEHDAKVGDFCHISTNAVVNGDARVGDDSFIGSGAVVLNQIAISDRVILGAGSVACCDILQEGIYRGNPAGRVK